MEQANTAGCVVDIVAELKTAWQDYQPAERKGLAFGKRLSELRAESKAQGNHSGEGFLQQLQQAGIPQRTAYYWIHNYEISIGVREPKEFRPARVELLKPPAPQIIEQPTFVEQPIYAGEVETTGTGRKTSRKTWTNVEVWDWLKDSHPAVYKIYEAAGFPRWIPLPKELRPSGWKAMRPTPSADIIARVKASCEYCAFHNSSRSCPIHGWSEIRNDHFKVELSFEDIQQAALDILNAGLKDLLAKQPARKQALRTGKIWAHAKLSEPAVQNTQLQNSKTETGAPLMRSARSRAACDLRVRPGVTVRCDGSSGSDAARK
jgi:hypothetical protein